MRSKDILTVVLEKFHKIPFTNKKVACQSQAIQRVTVILGNWKELKEGIYLAVKIAFRKFEYIDDAE